ncbi:MAG: tryptophan synthase subunit alpha [Alphaproteobacteria bacterium]|nr:tryptophan synthase subunit alpha [Alphaproteobacteria bacterium]
MLEDKIRALRAKKDILLMPHLVLGYPSFDANRKMIAAMTGAGAEIIEMQIPFSEPMSDGPVILKANDEALKNGTSTPQCLAFAKEVSAAHPGAIFVFMTYYNILFAHGTGAFVAKAKAAGIQGLIVPDLPPEEGADYIDACNKEGVAPIFIFTPTSTLERLKTVAHYCKGMVYCVGRKGVTGLKTKVDQSLNDLIARFRSVTNLPLALGFGIQEKADVDAITGHADIAVIGTKLLTLQQEEGIEAAGRFLKELRK